LVGLSCFIEPFNHFCRWSKVIHTFGASCWRLSWSNVIRIVSIVSRFYIPSLVLKKWPCLRKCQRSFGGLYRGGCWGFIIAAARKVRFLFISRAKRGSSGIYTTFIGYTDYLFTQLNSFGPFNYFIFRFKVIFSTRTNFDVHARRNIYPIHQRISSFPSTPPSLFTKNFPQWLPYVKVFTCLIRLGRELRTTEEFWWLLLGIYFWSSFGFLQRSLLGSTAAPWFCVWRRYGSWWWLLSSFVRFLTSPNPAICVFPLWRRNVWFVVSRCNMIGDALLWKLFWELFLGRRRCIVFTIHNNHGFINGTLISVIFFLA